MNPGARGAGDSYVAILSGIGKELNLTMAKTFLQSEVLAANSAGLGDTHRFALSPGDNQGNVPRALSIKNLHW